MKFPTPRCTKTSSCNNSVLHPQSKSDVSMLLSKQADFVDVLEKAIGYLDQAERYELMTGVFKLLLPFYEEQREFKVGRGVV